MTRDLDWFLAQIDGFKRNTLLRAADWVRDGMPAEISPSEHHVITAKLAEFRSELGAAPADVVDAVRDRLEAAALELTR